MRTNTVFVILALTIILGGVGYYVWSQPVGSGVSPTSTTTVQTATSTVNTTSDGIITFAQLPDFGLAVTPQQVLKSGYIPPCGQSFAYCLYYSGAAYQGTNFEDAGVSIRKRSDIATERLCLDTPPAGYAASITPVSTNTADAYSTSVFSPIGDAAMGHYATGAVYRLWVRNESACYEFQTSLGETQFANYPAGAIKEFTAADRQTVLELLQRELQTVTIDESGSPIMVFSGAKG